MNKLKKTAFILTASLAGLVFISACSKETKKTAEKKGKKVAAIAAQNAAPVQEIGKLRASRNGQYVNLEWEILIPENKIRQIVVARNSTGIKGEKQRRVAELEPVAKKHTDCLPGDGAYWYFLRIATVDNGHQDIGPVKVEPDKNGATNYINLEKNYEVNITRTDDQTTITWHFPEKEDYRSIEIRRFLRPASEPNMGRGQHVITTVNPNSSCKNALPDPNADYWYWAQIALKSGGIIYKGPIKAEYPKQ